MSTFLISVHILRVRYFFFQITLYVELIGNEYVPHKYFSYYFICDVIVNCTFVLFEHAFGKMTNPFIYLVFWLDLHLIITLVCCITYFNLCNRRLNDLTDILSLSFCGFYVVSKTVDFIILLLGILNVKF